MFNIKNDLEFQSAIGIDKADEETKAKLINNLEDLATNRLIIALSDRLTDDEIDDFSSITDEEKAYNWLETHVPDLRDLMLTVLDNMKSEIQTKRQEVME